ncbi:hypothetical protein [Bradyrhizobium sp. 2TAF24]|uniref:hypothetical protein n=1 Tax=Bradyrhizobium sp. 2TAF24 TaxID=3233011 RepID=UPI003F921EA9
MTGETRQTRLRDALRRARIEAADRTAVVVELRDAEVARLEILNDALDPLFSEIPDEVDLFDRGISRGDTPRLWVDVVAHVVMGRDKRLYRFVQDTRFGRIVLAESLEVKAIVDAVTDYVARRMIEREHALVTMPLPGHAEPALALDTGAALPGTAAARPKRRNVWVFVLGFLAGMAVLFGIALLAALQSV